jgi:hypothetical protein
MTASSPLPDLDSALAEAAIACAVKAKQVADAGGLGSTAEVWAAAAAQLAFAAKGIAAPLPARPAL